MNQPAPLPVKPRISFGLVAELEPLGEILLNLEQQQVGVPPVSQTVMRGQLRNIHLRDMLTAVAINDDLNIEGLADLRIKELDITVAKTNGTPGGAGPSESYRLSGVAEWNLDIGGTDVTIQAIAAVQKTGNLPGTGTIAGLVSTDIPFFGNLKIGAEYTFGSTSKQLAFLLELGNFALKARYINDATGKYLSITTSTIQRIDPATGALITSELTFGSLITMMVNLIDPNTDDFQLDPPWDLLNKFSLSGLTLEMNLGATDIIQKNAQGQTIGVLPARSCKAIYKPSRPIDLGFIKIKTIDLIYHPKGSTNAGVDITITGDMLGKPFAPAPWDAINDPPPTVPGQGATVFDLQYLGLGQHVSFANPRDLVNVKAVMDALRSDLVPLPPQKRNTNPLLALFDPKQPGPRQGELLKFNAQSSWMIGAQFTIIDTISLSLIFNDPIIYGLRLELSGEKAKSFAGLVFEILYRRISDTIGVYHVELVLPDSMRQLQFGVVSVTLPGLILDIYTNGDFAIDMGFPWKANFSRSFGLEVLIFTGAGGFYFKKLSAETSQGIVPAITNGTFNPVIAFGIGLKVGLGRTFNKGVLKAEISISVLGIVEGVIAWFNPANPALPKETYFLVKGGIGIVGRLYGSVDFVVIQVEVEVIVQVMVLFKVECHQPIYLAIEAQVSVRASIKILFIRIHFSFSLTVKQEFTLGSASPTPWTLAPQGPQTFAPEGFAPQSLAAGFAPEFAPEMAIAADTWADIEEPDVEFVDRNEMPLPEPTPLNWQPVPFMMVPLTSNAPDGNTPDSDAPDSDAPDSPLMANTLIASTLTSEAAPSPAPVKPTLHLYFQPAITRCRDEQSGQSQIKGIALLLIENTIAFDNGGPENHVSESRRRTSEFDLLAQMLLAWAVHAYRSTPTDPPLPQDPEQITVTLPELKRLFQMFVDKEEENSAPFNFENLQAFLAANFTLTLQVKSSGQLSGSIFPMLPQLKLTLDKFSENGTPQVISFGTDRTYQLTAAKQTQIAQYFRQLKVKHGDTLEQTSTPPGGTPAGSANAPLAQSTTSAAEVMFVDYFALLVRSLIQYAIEALEARNTTTDNLANVLNYLNTNGQLNHLAGTASRFFLAGLRLPVGDTQTTQPLYEKTGQQFTLPTPLPTGYGITLNTARAVEGLTLPTGGLRYVLPQALTDFIGELTATGTTFPPTDPNLTRVPELLPLYVDEPRRYNLPQEVPWTSLINGQPRVRSILDLPENLRSFLATQPNSVPLTLKSGSPAPGDTLTDRNMTPLDAFTWGTRIKLTVRRIAEAGDQIYLMVGMNETDKDLLEEVWTYLQGHPTVKPQLHLLYANDNGSANAGAQSAGLMNGAIATNRLLKTNLSTQSNPTSAGPSLLATMAIPAAPDTYSATLSDAQTFIQLLWEGSTVNSGGYYLHYTETGNKGLPAHLFTDGVNASVVLLVLLQPLESPVQNALPFHNCVVLKQRIDPANAVLIAESRETVKVQHVPAGNTGFQLTRSPASETATNNNGNDELLNLYQTLGYFLQDPQNLAVRSNEGLPVGPAESPTKADDDWHYERVVPIYSFFAPATPASHPPIDLTLPPAHLNPYAGIAVNRTLDLHFHWQDVYGNRFSSETMTKPKSVPIRYFDSLLGINQWPGVVESYSFQPGTSPKTALLTVELILDQTQFIPVAGRLLSDTQRATRSARALYNQIYYQIHQSDVTLTVHNSVLPDADQVWCDMAKRPLTDFIDTNYRYLSTLEALQAYPHAVQATDTLTQVSDIYYFTATAASNANAISEFDNPNSNPYYATIKAIATANAETYNLYSPNIGLYIRVAHKITEGETLKTIIGKTLSPPDSTSEGQPKLTAESQLEYIAIANRHQPGLLQVGQTITHENTSHENTPYTVLAGDTLASLAKQFALPEVAILGLIQEARDIWVADASLRLLAPYVTITPSATEAPDTLQSIERKLPDILAHLGLNPTDPISLADIAFANRDILLNRNLTNDLTNGAIAPLLIPDRTQLDPQIAVHLPAVFAIPKDKTLAELLPALKTVITGQLPSPTPANIVFSHPNPPSTTATVTAADIQKVSEVAAVAIANQSTIGLIQPNIEIWPTTTDANTNTNTNADPNRLSQLSSATLNAAQWQIIIDSQPKTRPNETFYTLAIKFSDILQQAKLAHPENKVLKENPQVTVSDLAAVLGQIPHLLVPNALLIIPPIVVVQPISLSTESLLTRYPDRIFPVTVEVKISRDTALVNTDVQKDVPEVAAITAFLSPKTAPLTAVNPSEQEQVASLRPFAADFEATFAGLHLALGNELAHKHSDNPHLQDDPARGQITRPLWAVHFSQATTKPDDQARAQDPGIYYNIVEGNPLFFTAPPLANTLLSGVVPVRRYVSGTGLSALTETDDKQVAAIDLTLLGRNFLAAVEDVLKPEIALPAVTYSAASINTILNCKQKLAKAIARQVTHILEPNDQNREQLATGRDRAAAQLQQQLLINLVNAYDIETILHYPVEVVYATPGGDQRPAPRLFGQPIVKSLRRSSNSNENIDPKTVNFTLSTAKVPLDPNGSDLTFFFDTKTPEKLEDIRLELVYQINEMEYDIKNVVGINDYQASSWLNFILPIAGASTLENANSLGNVDIPIPLRTYPIPPSLVLHRAEADPDSLTDLAKIREWQYTYVYEHLDIAQDAIETRVDYNLGATATNAPATTGNVNTAQQDLFKALVNFTRLYPQILPDLLKLEAADASASAPVIQSALVAIADLITEVTDAWDRFAPSTTALLGNTTPPLAHPADYEINENEMSGPIEVTIDRHDAALTFPEIRIPNYVRQTRTDAGNSRTDRFQPKPATAPPDPIFGESSIPDRILTIPDRDIIHHQSAWGGVWLTRNQTLLAAQPAARTNPAFLYQTPLVRFGNIVTPLLINTKQWDIASLSHGQPKPLDRHLSNLFRVVLPEQSANAYDLRIACRYAFALVPGNPALGEQNADLLSTLPVLLSPRLAIPANQLSQDATEGLRLQIAEDIRRWEEIYQPVRTHARYIFSLSLFSSNSGSSLANPNLPLLKIEHLYVERTAIAPT